MDHADDEDDDNVFVYMGGDQEVPWDVTHVRIHKSVKIIRAGAFRNCNRLVSIEMHDDVEIIEAEAFWGCWFTRIKLPGVRVIGGCAFEDCTALESVEFGDKLDSIEDYAFNRCISLRNIEIPKIRHIGWGVFKDCEQLTDAKLSEDLEAIGQEAFVRCFRLRRIAMPLKGNLLDVPYLFDDEEDIFYDCNYLSQVDLIGGIHKTISSLLLDSWRNEMNDGINQINRDLPIINRIGKTAAIRRWIARVLERMEHYKSEHYILLKNNTTQLELALWKANLDEKEEVVEEKQPAKKAKLNEELKDASTNQEANIDIHADKQQARVTCGANIIIPHVLSFLNDDDIFPLLNQNA